MKKIVLIILLLLISTPVFAGFLFESDFKYIEPAKNYLYISVGEVKNKKIGSKIRNIALVNLNTNEVSYFFDTDFEENIKGIFFETGFNTEEGAVEFNLNQDSDKAGNLFKNNYQIPQRPLKDKICILSFHPKNNVYSFWFCDKSGQNLKRVKTIDYGMDWWFDVKNNKICFVRQVEDKINFESIEW